VKSQRISPVSTARLGTACGLLKVGPGDIENEFQFYRAGLKGTEINMTLDSIPRDVMARIASVQATDAHGLRLMEMGLVPGARVRVVKAAPLGDPIQVCIHDYHLALRRTEARSIQVTVEE